jgi:hypothetical protein
MQGTWFFSLDEKHWPNFATIVTTDEHDTDSNLSRPDVFSLNIGVDRSTFEQVARLAPEPDYTTLDRLLPHPVYARQHWICFLNPSPSRFDEVVIPLLRLAHDRLATVRARHPRATA